MDFNGKELKVLLQALYRYRGEVSGASQSEQNQLAVVSSVIDKIEDQVGPVTAERTRFDREMAESLAVLATGKARTRAGAAAEAEPPAGKAAPKRKAAPKKTASATTAKKKTPGGAAKKTKRP